MDKILDDVIGALLDAGRHKGIAVTLSLKMFGTKYNSLKRIKRISSLNDVGINELTSIIVELGKVNKLRTIIVHYNISSTVIGVMRGESEPRTLQVTFSPKGLALENDKREKTIDATPDSLNRLSEDIINVARWLYEFKTGISGYRQTA
jgi:hypothetical protein